MNWITRTTETCDWRLPNQDSGRAVCGFLRQMTGINDLSYVQVSREACDACCRAFPPSVTDFNPTIASLLFQIAEQVKATGGVDGCDVRRADHLSQLALQGIPLTLPDEDDAILPLEMIQAQQRESWPGIEELLPLPSVRTPERITNWAVGVTTAQRRLPTLEICLNSLVRAGWSEVRLFVDDHGEVPSEFAHLPITRRDSRVGAWPNFYLGLAELFQRDPAADAYMIVQDDVIFYEHPQLRTYLEEALWPGGHPGLVSLFCSQLYAQSTPGWYRFEGQWQWGAQVFVFSNPSLRSLLSNHEVVLHRTHPQNGLALIDYVVGKWAMDNKIPLYFPTPSLAQHIGHTSTLWKAAKVVGGRKAGPFAGDLLDQTAPQREPPAPIDEPPEKRTETLVPHSNPHPSVILDCLGRTKIFLPPEPLQAEECIATIASDGFDHWLDDLLGSLVANAQCPQALLVVFVLDNSERCIQVAKKYGATVVRCERTSRLNATIKSVMYSVTHVIDAKRYICLDADMIVLEDLSALFSSIQALPPKSILACREANDDRNRDLAHAFETIYFGRSGEFRSRLGADDREHRYPLVVNDGLFAGSQTALRALDQEIRDLPKILEWVDEIKEVRWRNQFIFNWMLARLDCGVELDPRYNLQLWYQDVELRDNCGRLQADWNSRQVHVLHFCSLGRTPTGPDKYKEWRGRFARIEDPLRWKRGDNPFRTFLQVLRTWVGSRGLSSLRWSLYGTPDGSTGVVSDPSDFSLFGCLYYLIRSSGCESVLECGTGLGLSTACLASAVADRPGSEVVTFDIERQPEREDFWQTLPSSFQRCIVALDEDSLQGMDRLIFQSALFDAVLLDSLHTADHVWQEFERARRLVRPGGLILIHDVLLQTGSVETALRRIERAGYGVTRLWTTEGIQAQDNNLGLALIENRQAN